MLAVIGSALILVGLATLVVGIAGEDWKFFPVGAVLLILGILLYKLK